MMIIQAMQLNPILFGRRRKILLLTLLTFAALC